VLERGLISTQPNARLDAPRIYFRFSGIADMTGLAAGSTRSRMTRNGHRKVRRVGRALAATNQ
jgi:hypothetical protein